MAKLTSEKEVDALVKQFWRHGYLTLSRKFGTYLPEPHPIGNFTVDAVAKYKRKFAIGIVLSEADLNDPNIYSKINFLATRTTKYTHKSITLFIGVRSQHYNKAKLMISCLNEDVKKNIRLTELGETRAV